MITVNRAVVPLKVFLVVLFGILLVFQFLSLPGQFAYMAKEDPHSASLRWPLTAISIFFVLCVQVVVVSIWKLLTMVEHDRIFSNAAFVWVDAILGAITAGWSVLLAVFLYVGFHADDPGAPMMLFLLLTGVGVVDLLMVVMRALLRQATVLRTEMEGVL